MEALDEHGQWYRYQALFAEAHRLLGADTLSLLAQRASQWFEQQGMLSQAIEMAFLAQNITQTMSLVERFIATPCYKDLHEYHTLFRWLKHIPLVQLKQSPSLCLSYARALLFASPAGQLDQRTLTLVRELLSTAEVGFGETANPPALGEVFALFLPQSVSHAIGTASVSDDEKLLFAWIEHFSRLLPPSSDTLDRKFSCVITKAFASHRTDETKSGQLQ